MKKNVGKSIPQMLVDIGRIVSVDTDNCSLNHTLSHKWNGYSIYAQNYNVDDAPSC